MRELFEEEQEVYTLPQFREVPHEQAFDEIELLGFPLSSPFELIKEEPPKEIPAARLKAYEGKQKTMLGYYVCRKQVTTVRKKRKTFGTWLDREGNFYDSIHYPHSLAQSPFR